MTAHMQAAPPVSCPAHPEDDNPVLQSNGQIERWPQTVKGDALRPVQPATLEEAPAA